MQINYDLGIGILVFIAGALAYGFVDLWLSARKQGRSFDRILSRREHTHSTKAALESGVFLTANARLLLVDSLLAEFPEITDAAMAEFEQARDHQMEGVYRIYRAAEKLERAVEILGTAQRSPTAYKESMADGSQDSQSTASPVRATSKHQE